MKILIPILTSILVICGCSKQKEQITTPENATVILLCSIVLQTNDEIQITHRLDEIITGTLDPKFLSESKIIKGLNFPTIENENISPKYFILARPKAVTKGTDHFRLEYQWSGIPIYDEAILAHKNYIEFLQAEFDRQRELIK
jgi:hypothetical protein